MRRRDSFGRMANLATCKRIGWRQYLFIRRCQKFGYRFKFCYERGGTLTPRPDSGIVFCVDFWQRRTPGPRGFWYWLWLHAGRVQDWAWYSGKRETHEARFGGSDG